MLRIIGLKYPLSLHISFRKLVTPLDVLLWFIRKVKSAGKFMIKRAYVVSAVFLVFRFIILRLAQIGFIWFIDPLLQFSNFLD